MHSCVSPENPQRWAGIESGDLLDQVIFRILGNELLDKKHDGSVVQFEGPMAVSTDSFVVSPIFFKGGNIGELAVHGTVNDVAMADRMERIAGEVVGSGQVVVPDKTLGGEDMAFFLERVPGCFFCLGAGNDSYAGIHNPRFGFNEDILLTGIETYCRAAIDLLGKPSAATR